VLFLSGFVPDCLAPRLYFCANRSRYIFLDVVYVQFASSNVQFHHASFKVAFNFYA
jgi:hypothetical protein